MGFSGVSSASLTASWGLPLQQVGDEGAGHFVKMVHNGIEYGDMQLICEAYHLMKDVLGMEHNEMAKVSSGRPCRDHAQMRRRSLVPRPPSAFFFLWSFWWPGRTQPNLREAVSNRTIKYDS